MNWCQDHQPRKWRVVKRDGVWLTLDGDGKVRYAGLQWRMAYTFALVGAPRVWGSVFTFSAADLPAGWQFEFDQGAMRRIAEEVRRQFRGGTE